jgi:hypothetical protein
MKVLLTSAIVGILAFCLGDYVGSNQTAEAASDRTVEALSAATRGENARACELYRQMVRENTVGFSHDSARLLEESCTKASR